ncbi:MAG TPA: hypothetical protein VGM98_15765 [Schlesneria sp.]|jgi:hypothetical protein
MDEPTGHIATHVDVVLGSQDAAHWCQFVQGLRSTHATLLDGTPVQSSRQAVLWFCHQLRAK